MKPIKYVVTINTYGKYCNEDKVNKCRFLIYHSGFGEFECALFVNEERELLDREFFSDTPYRCKECLTLDNE